MAKAGLIFIFYVPGLKAGAKSLILTEFCTALQRCENPKPMKRKPYFSH